jgi:uncharacterized protein (TIGR03086 family)
MHTITNEIAALDAQAVRASVALVAQASPADMARPTPCADWTLHGLVSHMAAQHYGFAAAATGDGNLARWRPRRLGADPAADYRAAAETVLTAFSAEGVLDREFPLPEFPGAPAFPARQAVSFHFIDYVVHSWDVARSLGIEVAFTPGLLEAALPVAQAVPGGESRLAPGAAFAPAVAWPDGRPDGSPLDQIVAMLGRSPDWKRPELPVLPRVAVSRASRRRRPQVMPHDVLAAVPVAGEAAIASEYSAGEIQIASRPVVLSAMGQSCSLASPPITPGCDATHRSSSGTLARRRAYRAFRLHRHRSSSRALVTRDRKLVSRGMSSTCWICSSLKPRLCRIQAVASASPMRVSCLPLRPIAAVSPAPRK